MTETQHGQPTALDAITSRIIGAAIEVHREPGPGLLEATYSQCLCLELSLGELRFSSQELFPSFTSR